MRGDEVYYCAVAYRMGQLASWIVVAQRKRLSRNRYAQYFALNAVAHRDLLLGDCYSDRYDSRGRRILLSPFEAWYERGFGNWFGEFKSFRELCDEIKRINEITDRSKKEWRENR